MVWIVLIVLVALALGVIGFLVEAFAWLIAIAVALLVAGVAWGFLRGRQSAQP